MKDMLLKINEERYIECEIEDNKLTYTYGDEPNAHYVSTLKESDSYEKMKQELNELYESEPDEDEGDRYIGICMYMDTTDFHKKYFVGPLYLYFDLRTREEIEEYEKEAEDKVWLMRLCDIANKRPVHEVSRPAMERIMSTYDDIPKEGYSTWQCGYWNGIMAGLRWVLGNEKNWLDT